MHLIEQGRPRSLTRIEDDVYAVFPVKFDRSVDKVARVWLKGHVQRGARLDAV